jgi:predicted acyltransferase
MVQGSLLSYDINHIKFYTNTLQAIAAGYLIASVFLLYLPVFYQIAATLALMLSYWVILALLPVPGSEGMYTPEGNVAIFIERSAMGKFIGWGHYTWIISSINFGATVMLGAFAGYMMQAGTDRYKKFFNYIIFGSVLILLSLVMDIWHPIIKKIWTSSFVLFSGGICVLMLAVFYLIIDVWGLTKGTRWMIILGSNAIFGYVAWHLFEKQLVGMARVFLEGLTPVIGGWIEPLGYLGGFLVLYLVMWYMYKNKTFIKV